MSNAELIQVLKEVADDCFYRNNCDGCKFNKKSQCVLSGTPDSWDLEGGSDDIQ